MLKKYLLVFLVSMVPLIELRGGVPIAVGMGLDYYKALVVCISVSSFLTASKRVSMAVRSW